MIRPDPNLATFTHHRSGWYFALNAIAPLFRHQTPGVLFDAAIERTFVRYHDKLVAAGALPYRNPWIGVIHCPPVVPHHFNAAKSASQVFQTPTFQDSLPQCRGLIALAPSMTRWIASQLDVPVLALLHPTEAPPVRFSVDNYRAAGCPIVQVGWWLRRLADIERLPIPPERKSLQTPGLANDPQRFQTVLETEIALTGAPPLPQWNTKILDRLPNDAYDAMLCRSVAFLHLHNAVACNVIIECIVRHTPVLVNPLPSVIDYLGPDYPLYFHTLEEAAAKANNIDRIAAAHGHMQAIDSARHSADSFYRTFAESDFYRSL